MDLGVRARVTVIATMATVAVLVGAGWWLVAAQRAALLEDLDDSLREDAVEWAGSAADGALPDPIPPRVDDDAAVQVVGRDGAVLAATDNLRGAPPMVAPSGEVGSSTVEMIQPGKDYRLVSVRVDGLVVHSGAPTDDIADTLASLRRALWIGVPAASVALAVTSWLLIGRALRPVEAIRREMAAISAEDLHRRVPVPPRADEIGRLARTVNDTLARLEDASIRQRQFVADASHELRSPLARIRAELEVDAAHPHLADTARTRESVLEEIEVLQRLVSDLGLLARHGAGATGSPVPLALDELADDVARRHGPPSHLRVVTSAEPVTVRADVTMLRRAMANLLDNAFRHADSQVAVEVRPAPGDRARLVVADDGPGIPADQREAVFERFTRLDAARARDDGGSGLGLAIVRAIVTTHGGAVWAEANDPKGARIVVDLPLFTPGGG